MLSGEIKAMGVGRECLLCLVVHAGVRIGLDCPEKISLKNPLSSCLSMASMPV